MELIIKRVRTVISSHIVEVILIVLSLVLTVVSLFMHTQYKFSAQVTPIEEVEAAEELSIPRVIVDVSGAVLSPDVYEVTAGARLKDVIAEAGGLTYDADRSFFHRNYNLSRTVQDQEKVYIPSVYEVQIGLFTEPQRLIHVSQSQTPPTPLKTPTSPAQRTRINSASLEELDLLPGIGLTTAQKIADNRPYTSVSELSEKKIVKQNTYEAIKNLIDL
jgi:competence protein ComEA